MFEHESHFKFKIKKFLTCSILRWLPTFKELINESATSNNDEDKHTFFYNIQLAMKDTNTTENDVEIWQKIIKMNYCALPLQTIESSQKKYNLPNLTLDYCSIIEVTKDCTDAINKQHLTILNQEK